MKDERNKEVTLSTRVTKELYDKINKLAKKQGKRISEYMRDLMKEQAGVK